MLLAACHHSGVWNFEVTPGFLEKFLHLWQVGFLLEDMTVRDRLSDRVVDGMIILKLFLKK